jgi:SAM-dependent methyltransferase
MSASTTLFGMYRGRGAQLYDRLISTDKSEIRELLRNVDRGHDHVLELACGSGRITIPLLAVAASVTAVDNSSDLLAFLADRAAGDTRLTTAHADILSWTPRSTFNKVVLGTTSVSLFGQDDRETLFRRVRAWLAPRGQFLLTLRTPPSTAVNATEHIFDDGLRLREEFNPTESTLTSTLTEELSDGVVNEYSVTTYLVSRDELVRELSENGFEIVQDCKLDTPSQGGFIGDHRLLIAAPVRQSPYFEFFLAPSQWGEVEAIGAQGTSVTFADGTTAICAISGLWNASLGYGNSAIAEAIHRAKQFASTLPTFRRGNAYTRKASDRLLDWAGRDRYVSVFYSTSGSAALDAVVKLSRQVQKL